MGVKPLERTLTLEKEREEEAEVERVGGTPVEMIAAPKPGKWYIAKITEIRIGTFNDFIDIDGIIEDAEKTGDLQRAQRFRELRDKPAVMIEYYIPSLGIKERELLTYSNHYNSRFMQVLKCQGVEREGQYTLRRGDLVLVRAEEKIDRYGGRRLRFRLDCPPPEVMAKLKPPSGDEEE